MRLPNPSDFVPPRDDAFLAVLPNKFAQGVHQFGLHIFEPLVVGAKDWRFRRTRGASIPRATCILGSGGKTRRQGCRRYASRIIPVGWCKKTRLYRSNHVIACEAH